MGTRLLALGLDLRNDDPCLWAERHPESVREIHLADIHAGASLITTDTFGANAHWLTRFGRAAEADRIARAACMLAHEAIRSSGRDVRLAGSIGPTAIISERAFRSQVDVLVDSGVDMIVLETLSADEARRAVAMMPTSTKFPVVISLWNWGTNPSRLAGELADHGIDAWGVNCLADPETVVSILSELHDAGKPAAYWKPSIVEPDAMVRVARRCRNFGARWFGGCCGTTEVHVAALAREFTTISDP